ncbi:hypothetical protein [Arthrobacter sp. SLBN-112]|uniref:hypothetical protein n=1 Tax=Arthrobacter sp. SLBN-112 TaxID=2768452 RepID=UPI002812780C|nr:hypothetical protein [Arthrobacter sp. SLBN-112]
MLPRVAVAAAVVTLALSGCSSSPPTPAQTPTTPVTSATSSASAMPGALPSKVFTDQELTAIGAAMLQQRGQRPEFMYDSQQLRTALKSRPYPLTRATAQPAECGAFHLPAMDDAMQDPSLNFASGGVPIAGESSPTTTILFTMRSAPRDKLAKADFDYTDDLVSRCGQFEVSYEPQGGSSPYKIVLLKPPLVGEKAYAVMGPSQPFGSVGLRVLAGTLSISMSLSVSPLNSEADAQPALNSMTSIAQQLIDEAALNPPTVSPPPPNAKTPEQLTDLLQTITGPERGHGGHGVRHRHPRRPWRLPHRAAVSAGLHLQRRGLLLLAPGLHHRPSGDSGLHEDGLSHGPAGQHAHNGVHAVPLRCARRNPAGLPNHPGRGLHGRGDQRQPEPVDVPPPPQPERGRGLGVRRRP